MSIAKSEGLAPSVVLHLSKLHCTARVLVPLHPVPAWTHKMFRWCLPVAFHLGSISRSKKRKDMSKSIGDSGVLCGLQKRRSRKLCWS
jgi:hypothetical protein